MKTHTLPTLAILTLAAAAGAQTVPVKRATTSDLFSVGVTYAATGNVGNSGDDVGGLILDARVSVTNGVFLIASYTDASSFTDPILDTANPSAYGIGFGTKFAAGNGSLELSYSFHHLNLDFTPTPPATDTTDQHWIKAAYTLELGNGLSVSLGLTEILNSENGIDNVTAPELSVGYKFGQGFSAQLSFSTEDTLLGLPDADNTVSVGARYGF